MLEDVGERLVALLADHPDPEEWRRLLDKAVFVHVITRLPHALSCPEDLWRLLNKDVFIQCQGKERSEHQPSDEIIDAARDYVLADDRRKRSYLEDMGRGQYAYNSVDAAVMPRMAAILEDPVQFRDFIRNEEGKIGGGNGWAFLCRDIKCYERLWFRLLELGVFVSNQYPVMEPPQHDLFMEYIYIVDLDSGTFSVSACHVVNSGTSWKMGKIPKNWFRRLLVPVPWIELAIAYSPAVKRIVLERLNRSENFLFRMVVDKLSAPYQSFHECLNILQLIQKFLFAKNSNNLYAKVTVNQLVRSLSAVDQSQAVPQEDKDIEENDLGEEGNLALHTVLEVLLFRS
ncbi:hypothetical protein SELMODRAFT_404005 [Selaginella moellendorffii]|uniref:Uncharacterized protein n=1 Tax=Selaginella moellendorffii TaxID=88036 RepID=D8QT98_SELML|nr:hypothetical protein SELMODRAFT_404005 [Selaginella moellendorffii]